MVGACAGGVVVGWYLRDWAMKLQCSDGSRPRATEELRTPATQQVHTATALDPDNGNLRWVARGRTEAGANADAVAAAAASATVLSIFATREVLLETRQRQGFFHCFLCGKCKTKIWLQN